MSDFIYNSWLASVLNKQSQHDTDQFPQEYAEIEILPYDDYEENEVDNETVY